MPTLTGAAMVLRLLQMRGSCDEERATIVLDPHVTVSSPVTFRRIPHMKITKIESHIVRIPLEEPLANGPAQQGATQNFVTLRIGTDQGVEGVGFTFFGGAAMSASLKAAVDGLGTLTIGDDPLRIEAIVQKLRAAAANSGPGGIFTLALSAIDIALWDIRGKVFNQPLARLLGGAREKVPTYASGALMRGFPPAHGAKAAARLAATGFRPTKTQLTAPGDPNP